MVLARGRGISGAFRKCQTFAGFPLRFLIGTRREKAAGTEPAAFCPAEAGISGRCSRPWRQPGAGERESAGFSGSLAQPRGGLWGWRVPDRGIWHDGRTFPHAASRKDRAKKRRHRWDPRRGHSNSPGSVRPGSVRNRRDDSGAGRAGEPVQRIPARCRRTMWSIVSTGRSKPSGQAADGEGSSSEREVSGSVLNARRRWNVFRDVKNYGIYKNYQAKIVRWAPIFSIPVLSGRKGDAQRSSDRERGPLRPGTGRRAFARG